MPLTPDARLAPVLAAPGAGEHTYVVHAVRYGTYTTTRAACLRPVLPGDEHRTLQMDFFLWLVQNAERTVVVDTGFDPGAGHRRGRRCLADPVGLLRAAGVDPERVEDVVLTHLHYDHVGNLGAFPHATIHLHRREYEFWRSQTQAPVSGGLVESSELAAIDTAASAARARLIEHDGEVFPGVHVLWIGGHTAGQMVVVVHTRRSVVVLASDALHFYEELDGRQRFAVASDPAEAKAGFELLRRLAECGAVIVPGHDPLVLERFPRFSEFVVELA